MGYGPSDAWSVAVIQILFQSKESDHSAAMPILDGISIFTIQ